MKKNKLLLLGCLLSFAFPSSAMMPRGPARLARIVAPLGAMSMRSNPMGLSAHQRGYVKDPQSSWTVLSRLDQNRRVEFLHNNILNSRERNIGKYETIFFTANITMSEKFGSSATYIGDIEKEFLDYLSTIDNPGAKVFFPACGYGRSVLDALSETRNIQFVANDLEPVAMTALAEAADYFLPAKSPRLDAKAGDMLLVLKAMENQSIDAVFSANVIHFLDPHTLEQFMAEINRVLKPGGQAYLNWIGYNPDIRYNNLNGLQRENEPLIKRKHQNKEANPGFIEEESYNYLSGAEMVEIAAKNNLVLAHKWRETKLLCFVTNDRYQALADVAEVPLPENPSMFPRISLILQKCAQLPDYLDTAYLNTLD